jgi:four helix bundle protein
MSQGYRGLEIYKRAHDVAVEVHRMTLSLPKLEMFEEGAQIRRSTKSVAAQIVEGYCLRKNKGEFLQYLNRAYASAHESIEHLDLLHETGSLVDPGVYRQLHDELELLCKGLYCFMDTVQHTHGLPGFMHEATSTSHSPHPTSGKL